MKLETYHNEFTVIIDMGEKNHGATVETWNVKFVSDYFTNRGFVYHSKDTRTSFAFVVKNSSLKRKLIL